MGMSVCARRTAAQQAGRELSFVTRIVRLAWLSLHHYTPDQSLSLVFFRL